MLISPGIPRRTHGRKGETRGPRCETGVRNGRIAAPEAVRLTGSGARAAGTAGAGRGNGFEHHDQIAAVATVGIRAAGGLGGRVHVDGDVVDFIKAVGGRRHLLDCQRRAKLHLAGASAGRERNLGVLHFVDAVGHLQRLLQRDLEVRVLGPDADRQRLGEGLLTIVGGLEFFRAVPGGAIRLGNEDGVVDLGRQGDFLGHVGGIGDANRCHAQPDRENDFIEFHSEPAKG